jgi:hypothetical protein
LFYGFVFWIWFWIWFGFGFGFGFPTLTPQIFLLLKLEDVMDGDYRACVRDALPKLSKELVWKIWFELAQIEHRRGLLDESNAAYVQAARICPASSLWKVKREFHSLRLRFAIG